MPLTFAVIPDAAAFAEMKSPSALISCSEGTLICAAEEPPLPGIVTVTVPATGLGAAIATVENIIANTALSATSVLIFFIVILLLE